MDGRFYRSAEIMPPLLGRKFSGEIGDRIGFLSEHFDSFNIVTKPDRMDPIEFFDRHVKRFGPATVHYAVRDKDFRQVEEDLQRARDCGVESVLILGGDEPKDPEKRKLFASDAIRIARDNGYGFRIGAALNQHAVYPDDAHFEVRRLADKISAGTDCIFLQPTVDKEDTERFLGWASILLYEMGLNMPPLVDGVMIFDYEKERNRNGIRRARELGIPVTHETESEVLERGHNLGSSMELYRHTMNNGCCGVYFTPFSFTQYGTLDKVAGALKEDGT